MRRALFPLLMMSYIAYAEADSLKQDDQERSQILPRPSTDSHSESEPNKEAKTDDKQLVMQESSLETEQKNDRSEDVSNRDLAELELRKERKAQLEKRRQVLRQIREERAKIRGDQADQAMAEAELNKEIKAQLEQYPIAVQEQSLESVAVPVGQALAEVEPNKEMEVQIEQPIAVQEKSSELEQENVTASNELGDKALAETKLQVQTEAEPAKPSKLTVKKLADQSQPDMESEQYNNASTQPEQSMVTSSSNHPVYQRDGVFATGAFLWWAAHEDGLAYASSGFNTNPSGNPSSLDQTSVPRGSIKNFGGQYHAGFKLGVGYLFQETKWDIYFNWTRFRQHPSHKVHSDPNNLIANGSPLYDEWGDPAVVMGDPFTAIRADWRLNYNILDLEVGKTFMATKEVSVHPFAGLRGAFILQNFNIKEQMISPSTLTTANISIRNSNNFRAIGIRAGLDAGYHFFDEWEVFGSFAASILSGKFKVLNYQTTNDMNFPQPYLNVVDRFWSVKSELEAALGLRWATNFADDRCRIQFDVSWEELWWPGQNQMRRYFSQGFVDPMTGFSYDVPHSMSEKGDLGLHGLTFGARLDF